MSEEFSKSQAYALFGFVQQQIMDYCHTKVDQRIFENYVKERFDEITGRLDGHDSRFDRIESRLDKLETRMDRIESCLDKLEARMDRLEASVGRLEARVTNLENQMTEVLSILSLIARKLDVLPST